MFGRVYDVDLVRSLTRGFMFGRVIRHVWKGLWCKFGKVLSSLTFFDKSVGGFPSSEVPASLRAYLAFNAKPSRWLALETYVQRGSKERWMMILKSSEHVLTL